MTLLCSSKCTRSLTFQYFRRTRQRNGADGRVEGEEEEEEEEEEEGGAGRIGKDIYDGEEEEEEEEEGDTNDSQGLGEMSAGARERYEKILLYSPRPRAGMHSEKYSVC